MKLMITSKLGEAKLFDRVVHDRLVLQLKRHNGQYEIQLLMSIFSRMQCIDIGADSGAR